MPNLKYVCAENGSVNKTNIQPMECEETVALLKPKTIWRAHTTQWKMFSLSVGKDWNRHFPIQVYKWPRQLHGVPSPYPYKNGCDSNKQKTARIGPHRGSEGCSSPVVVMSADTATVEIGLSCDPATPLLSAHRKDSSSLPGPLQDCLVNEQS